MYEDTDTNTNRRYYASNAIFDGRHYSIVREFQFGQKRPTDGICSEQSTFVHTELTETGLYKFSLELHDNRLKVTGVGGSLYGTEPANPAQLVFQLVVWKWEANGDQNVFEHINYRVGAAIDEIIMSERFVLVRVLQKVVISSRNPCEPVCPFDVLKFVVGEEGQIFYVSYHFMCHISPKIRAFFQNNRPVNPGTGSFVLPQFTSDEFQKFLVCVTPECPTNPNPVDVISVLKLSHFLDVERVKHLCDLHLINCVEKTLVDRLVIAEKYQLPWLKHFVVGCVEDEHLQNFYRENYIRLGESVSADLMSKMSGRV
uniref:BTB domain-containing protein n=1 Tax=Globodera rostochiensis TaxID=31243 RepID=A0A914I6C2_GLORO